MFGHYQDHHSERDPVIRLWCELTGRTLSPREHHLFLRRTDTEALRGLLMQHGPEWMTAAGKTCLRRDERDQVTLKLADWVRACHLIDEDQRWRRERRESKKELTE